jgi:DNA gyrase subunit A
MRYTECRLAAVADELLSDIHEETVDWQPNFDDSENEPKVLTARLPNLLVNGSTGIGVAMATNIPPHNLREVCDGLMHLLEHPDAADDALMQFIKGPDFPTRAMICGRKGIEDAYRTGRGSVVIRARYEVEEHKNVRRIVFTEFPYQVTRKTIQERITELIRDGKLTGVTYVNDASDKDGLKLHVEIRRDADEQVVVNQLYQYTPLEHNFPVNMVALLNGRPQLLTLRELCRAHLDHRREVVRRRTVYRLRKARQRAHVVEGLLLAVADIDAIIAIIRKSADVASARAALTARPLKLIEHAALKALLPAKFYGQATAAARTLTAAQADAILAMTLSRLTGLAIEELGKEYAKLTVEIEGYETLLSDEKRITQVMLNDLKELKDKYGDDRRTELTAAVGEFDYEQLIEDEQVVVTISHEGYIKRVPTAQYRSRGRGTRGMMGAETKDGDFLEHLYIASTRDTLLFFTDRGKVYWLKVYEVPEMARTAKGRAVVNLLQMADHEKIAAVLPVGKFDERFIMLSTSKGLVKKTALGAYARPMKKGIIAAALEDGDSLIGAALTDGRNEVVLGTREGMSIRFHEEDVRAMGRQAYGVKGIELEGPDEVVDMVIIDPTATLLTVCENGFGKRTELEEYRRQNRGGKGLINIKASDRNGKVVALKSVKDSDDLMMISHAGVMNRISVSDIRSIGRATQGVKLMNLDDADKVVAVARVVKSDEEGVPGAGGPAAGAPPAGGAPPTDAGGATPGAPPSGNEPAGG